jgi:CHAT domain-containing protein/tetratricopeptide (TPR) repeat protein
MIQRTGSRSIHSIRIRQFIYHTTPTVVSRFSNLSSGALPARSIWLFFSLFYLSMVFCLLYTSACSAKAVPLLGAGATIERELATNESHTFRVSMKPGEYLHVVVEQHGINVSVALYEPKRQAVAEMDGAYGDRDIESVSLLAQEAGDYQIEIRPITKETATGRYVLRIDQLHPSTQADIFRISAERAYMQGRKLSLQSDQDSLHSAIKKYKEALPNWQGAGDGREEAKTLYSIGVIYRRIDDMSGSVSYLSQALSIQRAILDRRGEGYTLNELGLAYGHLDGQKAFEYLFQALELWRAEGDKINEALTLNILGGIHDSLGMPHEALNYFNQALTLRREVTDLGGQVSTLNNIAVIYDEFGDAQNALSYYSQALAIAAEMPDLNVEVRRTKARALSNVGYTYLALGDPEKSLEYSNQALPIQKETYDRRGEVRTLILIGYAYTSLGNHQDAFSFYNQALSTMREIGDEWGQVYALAYMGSTCITIGQKDKALQYYSQALQVNNASKDRQGRATVLDKIGKLYVSMGQLQKGMRCFNQALPLWKAIKDRRGEATTLLGLANAERGLGDLYKARSHAEAAIKSIEFLRTRVAGQQERMIYFASVREYYDLYIDVLMRMHKASSSAGHNAEALQASERARARSLLEILAEAGGNIRQGVDPDLLDKERTLGQQIDVKADRLTLLLKGDYTQEQRAEGEKEMKRLLADYQQVQAQIRANSPHYAGLTQPEIITAKEIQQNVLDSDTMWLEYYLGEEKSYLWAVTPSSIKSYELPKRSELETKIETVYKLMKAHEPIDGEAPESRQARVDQADARYWQEATELSQALLGPVASILGKKRLLVVAEGTLQYVSFPALPAPVSHNNQTKRSIHNARTDQATSVNFTPLIVDHEIVYLPSASVLALMRRELADRQPAPKAVAVLADPVFSKDDPRVNSKGKEQSQGSDQLYAADLSLALRDFGMTRDGLNLPRLLSLRREAEDIAEIVPAEQCLKALDFDANMVKATSAELKQYRIIHFATHGLLNNKNPELSAIVLSLVNEQGQSQNGLLKLHDIYNLDLPAELVVLSACDTGLGKQIKGEGLVGLTRGFMYAGAARVVASLWKVNSLQTEKLMKSFYRGMLVEGLRPVKALQKAQVEMWENSRKEVPSHWAAFVLQGEWR